VEDFRDVFSAKDVEAVIICTPNFHHIEVRMYECTMGLHDG
jgi:predicted dehydrogenase